MNKFKIRRQLRIDYHCRTCENIGEPPLEHRQKHEIDSLKQDVERLEGIILKTREMLEGKYLMGPIRDFIDENTPIEPDIA